MPSHRAESPGRRAAPPPGRRRADRPRPRYGRLAVLGASLSVTGIAMLGSIGVLPSVASGDSGDSGDRDTALDPAAASTATEPTPSPVVSTGSTGGGAASTPHADAPAPSPSGKTEPVRVPEDPPVPEDSGDGKRIVFDQSDQRVWLVDEDGEVVRTYLVSGSLYDNLDPGSYSVYSRSEDAVGIDDSGTMRYFVRFTQGDNGAAIGFHDIPVDEGAPVQTVAQLGTPQSHGCIRQEREDAIALWEFAPIGTEVTVTA